MKKLLLSLCMVPAFSAAKIVETKVMEDLYAHIEDDQTTLVVFDLDNTVFTSPYDFGGDAWFQTMVKSHMSKGLNLDQAVGQVLPMYVEAQRSISQKLVESATADIICALQKKHIPIVALSSRSVPIEERTIQQLRTLGVDFARNPLSPYEISLGGLAYPCFYKQGILFSGQNSKGDVLIAFLDYLGVKPSRVILIDDKEKYLHDVQRAMDNIAVEFVGIRYARADEDVAHFNPFIAKAQCAAFKHHFALDRYLPLAQSE